MPAPGEQGLIADLLHHTAEGRSRETIWEWKLCRACDAIEPPDHDCPYGSDFTRPRLSERVTLATLAAFCLVVSLCVLAALGYGVSDLV